VASTFSSKDNHTMMHRIGVQWNWDKKWLETKNWYLTGYWESSLGYWYNNDNAGKNTGLVDIGITPVFRYQRSEIYDFVPYIELAVGAHYLTDKDISARKKFSTHFQFGDHLAAGFVLNKHYDLSYHFQHLSNANIKSPNPGINFHQIRFQYHF